MGINVKVQKSPKAKDVISASTKLERDLKICMHCRFFYGNNHQCILSKCVKEEVTQKVIEEEKQNKCLGCPYPHTEGYCFPCMKEILELIKKPVVIKQEEKKDG